MIPYILLTIGMGQPAPAFIVENHCPTVITVTNRIPVVATATATYRSPIGHTHTCSLGHSWDHTANPTHRCLVCGREQWETDPVPRPVLVMGVTAPLTYSLPSGTSGCIGGNCPAPTQRRWRLFP